MAAKLYGVKPARDAAWAAGDHERATDVPSGHSHYRGWCNACMNEGGRLATDVPRGATYRHAKGFGAYAKATGEPRHSVRASQVWTDAQGTYCGQCAHPVVEVRPKWNGL